jgi:hypothetical protein
MRKALCRRLLFPDFDAGSPTSQGTPEAMSIWTTRVALFFAAWCNAVRPSASRALASQRARSKSSTHAAALYAAAFMSGVCASGEVRQFLSASFAKSTATIFGALLMHAQCSAL